MRSNTVIPLATEFFRIFFMKSFLTLFLFGITANTTEGNPITQALITDICIGTNGYLKLENAITSPKRIE